jgi:erythrocyte band 7 integral membrane protein
MLFRKSYLSFHNQQLIFSPQEILSKDSVTVSVDAVVYFRTSDPIASVNNVDDAVRTKSSLLIKPLCRSTQLNCLHKQLFVTLSVSFYNILIKNLNFPGMKTLTEMLTEREAIAQLCETILDEGTEHWGVKVSLLFFVLF